MKINDEDLEVIGYNAMHGPGGQHVARPCPAVLVIHKPTGIGVRVDDERSQFRCKRVALARLQSVLDACDASNAFAPWPSPAKGA